MLAEKLGKSEEYVYGRLKLLALTKDLQQMFLEGEITAGHAILIARLAPNIQQEVKKHLYYPSGWSQIVGQNVPKQMISVRDLNLFIQRRITRDLSKVLWDVNDAELVKKAGACISCPKRTGAEPGLWPELKKGDHCTDGECFNTKLAARVEQLVDEQGAVRVTEDYNAKKSGQFYIHNLREIKKGSCKSAVLGIVIDGRRLGESFWICSDVKCTTHRQNHGGPANYAKASAPQIKFNQAKENIAGQSETELRQRIYMKACERLDLANFQLKDIAGSKSMGVVLELVYERLDNSVRKAITEELKLRKGEYSSSAPSSQIAKTAAGMDPTRLLMFISRLAMKNLSMGFNGGWAIEKATATKRLTEIAESLGVKIAPIQKEVAKFRAEKMEKAKKRFEAAKAAKGKKGKKGNKRGSAQTSAKPGDLEDFEDGGDD
jgi:hypothetical protein